MKKKSILLITFSLSILILILVIYILIRSANNPEIGNINNTQEFSNIPIISYTSYPTSYINNEKQPKNSSVQNYSGKYIKGNLPSNWSLTEFTDSTGMIYKVDNINYSGFTGFEIKQENNITLLKIGGVYGIGDIDQPCSTIYLFGDTNPNYIDFQKEGLKSFGEEPNMNIIDYTKTKYQLISLFDTEIRRIGTEIFTNLNPETRFFNSRCKGSKEILKLSGLGFYTHASDNNITSDLYRISINTDFNNESELKVLDETLNSLEIINK